MNNRNEQSNQQSKQQMFNQLERFHQQAVKLNLSLTAILLWQQLYFTMTRKQNFTQVQIPTAVLLAQLNISRSSLLRARQSLIEAGLLESGVTDGGQEIWYTLITDGLVKIPSGCVVEKSACLRTSCTPRGANFPTALPDEIFPASFDCGQISDALDEKNAALSDKDFPASADTVDYANDITNYPSGDIIYNNGYEQPMREFTTIHDDGELHGVLRQWAEMRKDNGWELSLWGLQELLKKLAVLAKGDIKTMIATVRQSIARRWKGFHPLRKECKPSGEKLRQEEQRAEWMNAQGNRNGRTTQKFANEGRDLSYLVI